MALLSDRVLYNPLTPTYDYKYKPDQTEVVEVVKGQEQAVFLPDVKKFLSVRNDHYDVAITSWIHGVTEQVENFIRRDLIQKKLRSYWYTTPPKAELPMGPHGEITKVTVKGKGSSFEYDLEEGSGYEVEGMTFKRLYGITDSGQLYVEFISGYDKDKRPERIISAILQEIALQFKNRQDPDTPAMTSVNNLSLEARHLLSTIMRRGF